MSDLAIARGCDVTIIGCGVPKRSMGWYHAKQILDGRVPSARLTDIVEPWLLGKGQVTEDSQVFSRWAEESAPGVALFQSLQEMPKPTGKKLALITSRTADMPQLFSQAVEHGFSHICLEKPGATHVSLLEGMALQAERAGVEVMVGYNKNVSEYVTLARAFAATLPDASTTFVHNNDFRPETLGECFERNAEGLLKNMAVHELALLVTYYDVKVDTIAEVIPDLDFSRLESHAGPSSGQVIEDFSRVGFTIVTKAGKRVSVKADRCGGLDFGGSFSEAHVIEGGSTMFSARIPDQEGELVMRQMMAAEPGTASYFHLQDPDYITLKERFAKHIAAGEAGLPEGVANINIAIEVLRLAEHLTPILKDAMR